MKLFRHGPAGQERAGALDSDGGLRDLSLLVPDLTPDWLSAPKLKALQAIDLKQLPLLPEGTRIGMPVNGVRQFLAIGLNYRKHAEEAGMEVPSHPVVFHKAVTSLAGPNDDVVLPEGAQQGDWEVELGIVIGGTVRRVTPQDALTQVAGYVLANDVSEREWQTKRGPTWSKGKSFDSFGPIGPWLVTADELPDPHNIDLDLAVNGQTMQRSSTADMIFSVAEIVSHLSQFMTLLPGDVIITGTPSGVGLGMKPPRFLKAGDVITLSGGVLGTQRQQVR